MNKYFDINYQNMISWESDRHLFIFKPVATKNSSEKHLIRSHHKDIAGYLRDLNIQDFLNNNVGTGTYRYCIILCFVILHTSISGFDFISIIFISYLLVKYYSRKVKTVFTGLRLKFIRRIVFVLKGE